MLKKKIMFGAASALVLLSMTSCGTSKDIATMKGGKITVEDFYNKVKTQQNSQQLVSNMIISEVFGKKYGDKVKDSEITKKFNETKKKLGNQFKAALKQAGLTEKSYKEQLCQQLALEKGLESHVKIKDKDLKTAFKTFHPEVSARVIVLDDKAKADEVLKEVKAEGADFAKIAKEKSVDTATKSKGGSVKFDSTSTTIPNSVQTVTFSLKNGETSEIITYSNPQTYQSQYYIVQMVKNKAKGTSMKSYKAQLKEIAKQNKLKDPTFQTDVIGKELKKANVKIQDSAFSDVLSIFTGVSSSTSSKKASSNSKSSANKSSSKISSSSTSSSTTEENSSTESSSEPSSAPAESSDVQE
ncbi:MAG: peptidylprolyl isomerase [Streptococcaceae bacterium]|jgi:foldase protein PrsA|nr:peptidylprolyl isomerase [Streptococcaceae bacterium]